MPRITTSVAESPLDYRVAVCSDHFAHAFNGMNQLTTYLFRKKFLYRTLLSIFISTCLFMGLGVLNIWLASLLEQSEHHAVHENVNCSMGSKTFLQLEYTKKGSRSLCTVANVYPARYIIPLAGSILLGRLALLFLIDRMKRTLALSMLLAVAGVCCSLLPFFDVHVLRMCLAFVFMACYAASLTVFSIITIEIFPTCVRGTANGLIPILARIGLTLVLRHFWSTCIIALESITFCVLIASFASLFLPDRRKKPMME
ncbi:synaptic vesicle glycoprotein 2B-like [Periplaneta americana]|uniref:synaptic vesicle glycoprotein 2B-like n=1 Tax=Periplaneta americana TaxID=6978 RepID=UPI0037E835F0